MPKWHLNFFFFLAMPLGTWDLSSSTRDRTHAPCVDVQSLNHWTTKEVPRVAYVEVTHSATLHHLFFCTQMLNAITVILMLFYSKE